MFRRGPVDTPPHFFSSFRTTKSSRCCPSLGFGVFWQKSLCCEKRICVFIRNHNGWDLCNNEHVRIHTRTAKNTTLHRSSMHSDNDTDPKHDKTRQFRGHLDQYRNCLSCLLRVCGCDLLIPCWSKREWVEAALGRRWTRQRVAAIKQRDPSLCGWC